MSETYGAYNEMAKVQSSLPPRGGLAGAGATSGGRGGGEVTPLPSILVLAASLLDEVGQLHQQVTVLEKQLDPILLGVPGTPETNGRPPRPTHPTELGERLLQLGQGLLDLRTRLHGLEVRCRL